METKRLPEIEWVNPNEVVPYWRNPRNIDAAVDAVAESIKEFGMNNPILVDSQLQIINGHVRYKACQKLEMNPIPIIVCDWLTDEQITAYRVIDNKTAEKASWNKDDLEAETRAAPMLARFETYFPELKLTPVNLNTQLKPVTPQDIQKSQAQINSGYQRAPRIQTIMCPHCGEKIEIVQ